MNSTLIMSPSTVTSPTSPLIKTVVGITTATQVTYSIICTIAFLGNTLVILVFVWDKKLLNKSYNILILSLAIVDVLTAITLITNPAFVIGDGFPHPTNSVLGELLCRVIWSRVFLFQHVVFSVYLCLALTAERCFAIMRPQKYGAYFNKKRSIL